MNNPRYSPEFKNEAVRQVIDRGYSVPEVAQRHARHGNVGNVGFFGQETFHIGRRSVPPQSHIQLPHRYGMTTARPEPWLGLPLERSHVARGLGAYNTACLAHIRHPLAAAVRVVIDHHLRE